MIIASGIAVTVVAALLQLQGYAYRAGYFDYFGLDSGMFDVSAGNLMWQVALAWTEFTVKILKEIWSAYWQMVEEQAWIFSLFILGFIWLAKACLRYKSKPRKFGSRLQRWFQNRMRWFRGAFLGRRVVELLVSSISPLVIFSVAPLLAFCVAIIFSIGFVLLLYPFYQLGGSAAERFCEMPVESVDRVWLVNANNTPRFGYRISCDDAKCAVLIDRIVRIFPSKDVAYIEVAQQAERAESKRDGGFCPIPKKKLLSKT